MALLGGAAADGEAQGHPAVDDGAGEQRLAGVVGRSDQRVGRRVGSGRIVAAQAEHSRFSGAGATTSKRSSAATHPASSRVSADVAADHRLHRRDPVGAQREPQLQRAEPAAERDLPVAVVDRRAGLGGRRAQVLGQDAQRAEQARRSAV